MEKHEASEEFRDSGFQQNFTIRSQHRISYSDTGDRLTSRVIKIKDDADTTELFMVQAYLGDSIGDYAMEFGPFYVEDAAYRFSVLLNRGTVLYHDSAPFGFEYFDKLGVNDEEDGEIEEGATETISFKEFLEGK